MLPNKKKETQIKCLPTRPTANLKEMTLNKNNWMSSIKKSTKTESTFTRKSSKTWKIPTIPQSLQPSKKNPSQNNWINKNKRKNNPKRINRKNPNQNGPPKSLTLQKKPSSMNILKSTLQYLKAHRSEQQTAWFRNSSPRPVRNQY